MLMKLYFDSRISVRVNDFVNDCQQTAAIHR